MRKEKRNLAITEIFMILIAVIWFIPIYYLIVTTLKSSQEATANPLGLPKVLRLDNYVNAWVNMEFPRAFGNIIYYCNSSSFDCYIWIYGRICIGKNKVQNGNQSFSSVPCRTDCSVSDEHC